MASHGAGTEVPGDSAAGAAPALASVATAAPQSRAAAVVAQVFPLWHSTRQASTRSRGRHTRDDSVASDSRGTHVADAAALRGYLLSEGARARVFTPASAGWARVGCGALAGCGVMRYMWSCLAPQSFWSCQALSSAGYCEMSLRSWSTAVPMPRGSYLWLLAAGRGAKATALSSSPACGLFSWTSQGACRVTRMASSGGGCRRTHLAPALTSTQHAESGARTLYRALAGTCTTLGVPVCPAWPCLTVLRCLSRPRARCSRPVCGRPTSNGSSASCECGRCSKAKPSLPLLYVMHERSCIGAWWLSVASVCPDA